MSQKKKEKYIFFETYNLKWGTLKHQVKIYFLAEVWVHLLSKAKGKAVQLYFFPHYALNVFQCREILL